MSNPKVTIGLVLFKGEDYLRLTIPSLMAQDYPNLEFLFRDHSPAGEASEFLKKEFPDILSRVKIERGENILHGGGHNALIRQMTGDWYFSASNDIWYSPDFVSKVMAELAKPENQKIGSATGKLLVWDFAKAKQKDLEGSKTTLIDSCGIGIAPSHRFWEIGQGEQDSGQYDGKPQVFGPSAAAGFYRKSALDDVAFTNDKGEKEYFDSLLHYKNDCDLAYRLQWAGFGCRFIPQAKAWHDRQASSRSSKSAWTKGNSYFGQLVTVRKNFSPDFSWKVKILTGLRQAALWVYAFALDYPLFHQQFEVQKLAPLIDSKRKAMPRRVKAEEIERLMS